MERYNGVTNRHRCESFGLLTRVAGRITSLPRTKKGFVVLEDGVKRHAGIFFPQTG